MTTIPSLYPTKHPFKTYIFFKRNKKSKTFKKVLRIHFAFKVRETSFYFHPQTTVCIKTSPSFTKKNLQHLKIKKVTEY